jgi:glycine/D-amino acid oxidase-like deaminating enzyme
MERFDAVVVGGGLLGAAAAYHLALGGARTLLLEKDELNRQASGQNAGSLHFQLEFRMVELGDAIAEQFAVPMPLFLEAQRTWAALEQELGDAIEVHLAGGLMVAETREQRDVLERKSALERRHGLETHVITGDEARAIAPYLSSAVRAACWCPAEGHANPRLVGPAFAAAAVRHGATVRTRARVVGLARTDGGWRVTVRDAEPVHAEVVVVAAGLWTGEVTAMADAMLPIVPRALTMLATARTEPSVEHLVQHVGARLSLKQTGDGNVLVGGGWPARLRHREGVVDVEQRPVLRYESITGSAAVAARLVPSLRGLPVIRVWSGVVGVTPDQVPLLGELHGRPGLYVATGGAGFTLGPTLGRLLSELILSGRPSLPLDLYDPVRYGHLIPV